MVWYFIRYTSDTTSLQALSELLGSDYLISEEHSKRHRLHYHILYKSDASLDEVKNLFYSFEGKPRGNPTLNVKIIDFDDFIKTGAYTVKDGMYIYSESLQPYIAQIVDASYQAPPPYNTAINQLIENYTDNEYHQINWQQLKIDIAILRAQYHLEIYRSKIEALVLSIQISMNHNVAIELFSSD